MSTPRQYELMARYNAWMNGKLYAVCAEMSDAERRRDLGAFFRSVHGTLNHLLFGDRAWLGRFTGERFELRPIGEDLFEDFSDLSREREAMDDRILCWARGLDPDWLAADFEYTSGIDRITRVVPAWILVTHMFNHQTHHRGQLTTLIKQLGYEPGVTDIPWMPGVARGDPPAAD
jgi:uncharacterized damage-inducible protein DinB